MTEPHIIHLSVQRNTEGNHMTFRNPHPDFSLGDNFKEPLVMKDNKAVVPNMVAGSSAVAASDNLSLSKINDSLRGYQILADRCRYEICIQDHEPGYTNRPEDARDIIKSHFSAVIRRAVYERKILEFQVKIEKGLNGNGCTTYKLYEVTPGMVYGSSRYRIATATVRTLNRFILPKE